MGWGAEPRVSGSQGDVVEGEGRRRPGGQCGLDAQPHVGRRAGSPSRGQESITGAGRRRSGARVVAATRAQCDESVGRAVARLLGGRCVLSALRARVGAMPRVGFQRDPGGREVQARARGEERCQVARCDEGDEDDACAPHGGHSMRWGSLPQPHALGRRSPSGSARWRHGRAHPRLLRWNRPQREPLNPTTNPSQAFYDLGPSGSAYSEIIVVDWGFSRGSTGPSA